MWLCKTHHEELLHVVGEAVHRRVPVALGVLCERLEDDREDRRLEVGDLLHDVLVVPQEQRALRHLRHAHGNHAQ